MRFVVHLGPHKTGTTYLQQNFTHARAALRELGVYFPEFWGPGAHYELIKLLQARSPILEEQFRQLHAGPHHTVLLSAEGLANLPIEAVEYWSHLLRDAEVQFVFYVRSWSDLLPSIWRELIKEGWSARLPEFLLPRLLRPEQVYAVNFALPLGHFEQIFGGDTLRFVSYDQLLAAKLDLYVHFMSTFLNLTNLPPDESDRVNASLSDADNEVIRTLNALFGIHVGRAPKQLEGRAISTRYLKMKDKLLTPGLQAAIESHVRTETIDDSAPELARVHAHLFERFGSRLVNPKPKSGLFRPRARVLRHIDPAWHLRPGVAEELASLYEAVHAAAIQPLARPARTPALAVNPT